MSGRQLVKYLCSVVHLSYLPLQLSPAFLMTSFFEDEALTNDLLLDSFRFYVSSDDRDILANCIAGNVHPNDDELLDFLSSFKCYRNATEQNIKESNPRNSASRNCTKTTFCGQLLANPFYKTPEID